jgi:hypothetical protein
MHPRAGKQKRSHTRQTRITPAQAPPAKKILGSQSPAPVRKGPQRVKVSDSGIAADMPAPALQSADSAPIPLASRPLDVQQEKTLTVKEAAFLLHKSPDAIYLWLRTGRLQGLQPGGRCCSIMVLESSVQQALVCALGRG